MLNLESSGAAPVAAQVAETLTKREIEVLKLVTQGMSTKQVGIQLGITFKTAASHRSHILEKLGVHETVSAVRWAIRTGLINP